MPFSDPGPFPSFVNGSDFWLWRNPFSPFGIHHELAGIFILSSPPPWGTLSGVHSFSLLLSKSDRFED